MLANFMGITASNGIKLKKGADEYLERFHFSGEDANVGIDGGGCLFFYGYSWLTVYKRTDPGEDEDCEDEFFQGLRQFVPEKSKLIIQRIGYEKCRFPLSAQSISITRRRVTYKGIECE